MCEDGSNLAAVQRGQVVSPFPRAIVNREERIQAFQRFVLERCGLPILPDPALAAAG
jgi:hypothetical protein